MCLNNSVKWYQIFQAWKTDDLKKMEKGFLAVRNAGKVKI